MSITLIILLGINGGVFGQKKIRFGPSIGVGTRFLTGNKHNEVGVGFHLGVATRIPFNSKLSFDPELAVSRKGYYEVDFDIFSGSSEINQRLTYLDIYLPVKYKLVGIFNVSAGLQTGYLIKGVMLEDSFNEYGTKFSIYDKLNKLDIGILARLGVQFKMGLGLNIQYNHGFINIFKEEPDLDNYFYYQEDSNQFNGKNNLVTLDVYYLFGYHKEKIRE